MMGMCSQAWTYHADGDGRCGGALRGVGVGSQVQVRRAGPDGVVKAGAGEREAEASWRSHRRSHSREGVGPTATERMAPQRDRQGELTARCFFTER